MSVLLRLLAFAGPTVLCLDHSARDGDPTGLVAFVKVESRVHSNWKTGHLPVGKPGIHRHSDDDSRAASMMD